MYRIETNEWSSAAPLNIARKQFGVCALGDYIYAFGGAKNNNTKICSIEQLNARQHLYSQYGNTETVPRPTWTLIEPEGDMMTGRCSPLVAPIS